MSDLLLASASPRRAELLERLVPAFDVVDADVDEGERMGGVGTDPADLVVSLATAKVRRAAELRPHPRVIGADTVVVVSGLAMGKPDTAAAARAFLEQMARQRVEVVTGTALMDAGELSHEVVTSTLWMADRNDELIGQYVASGAWSDKAGGLEVQGRARVLVHRVEGCWTNVVGLPLCAAARLLGVGYPVGACDVPAPSAS